MCLFTEPFAVLHSNRPVGISLYKQLKGVGRCLFESNQISGPKRRKAKWGSRKLCVYRYVYTHRVSYRPVCKGMLYGVCIYEAVLWTSTSAGVRWQYDRTCSL